MRNPSAEPRRCSSRPLIASVGPLLVPGRSSRPARRVRVFFNVRPSVVTSTGGFGTPVLIVSISLTHQLAATAPVLVSVGGDHSPRRVWRHTCSSTRIASTPSKRVLVVDQHPFAFGQDSVVGSVPRDPESLGDPGTVRCRHTIASSAHRSPRRDSFARGSAARLVSWRHT